MGQLIFCLLSVGLTDSDLRACLCNFNLRFCLAWMSIPPCITMHAFSRSRATMQACVRTCVRACACGVRACACEHASQYILSRARVQLERCKCAFVRASERASACERVYVCAAYLDVPSVTAVSAPPGTWQEATPLGCAKRQSLSRDRGIGMVDQGTLMECKIGRASCRERVCQYV